MPICENCHKFISAKRMKRHKESRCMGKRKKVKMPKRKRGTGIDPTKVKIVGGSKEQKEIVKESIERGEIDEINGIG